MLEAYLSVALVVPLLPHLPPRAGLARVHHPLALKLAVSLVLLVWGWDRLLSSQNINLTFQDADVKIQPNVSKEYEPQYNKEVTGASPAAMRLLPSQPCAAAAAFDLKRGRLLTAVQVKTVQVVDFS